MLLVFPFKESKGCLLFYTDPLQGKMTSCSIPIFQSRIWGLAATCACTFFRLRARNICKSEGSRWTVKPSAFRRCERWTTWIVSGFVPNRICSIVPGRICYSRNICVNWLNESFNFPLCKLWLWRESGVSHPPHIFEQDFLNLFRLVPLAFCQSHEHLDGNPTDCFSQSSLWPDRRLCFGKRSHTGFPRALCQHEGPPKAFG